MLWRFHFVSKGHDDELCSHSFNLSDAAFWGVAFGKGVQLVTPFLVQCPSALYSGWCSVCLHTVGGSYTMPSHSCVMWKVSPCSLVFHVTEIQSR